MNRKIHLGKNLLSGRRIDLPFEELKNHMHIIGRTRQGKSKLLERIARDIIKSGHGLLMMDGKGDLYEDLLKFCAVLRKRERTLLVDPSEKKYSPGINYLELFTAEEDPATHAKIVMEGLKKMFGEQDVYKPWLEEWGLASLVPLIQEKQTLLELLDFVSVVNSDFRDQLIWKTKDNFLRFKWDNFAALPRKDQVEMTNVLRTRASEFWYTPAIRHMLGQKKTTINWRKVMDTGGIVLCNLGIGPDAHEGLSNFLGAVILHQVIYTAYTRPPGQRKAFYIIVDEFNRFVCHDFCEALDRLAGLGIYVILAHQYIEQIKQMDPQLMSAVNANCLNKVSFSVSREDAELAVKEFFTGYISGDIIKDEIRQTKFRPQESTRKITGHATGSSSSDGYTRGESSGQTYQYPSSLGQGTISIEQSTAHSSSSSSFSSSSEAIVPWYEYIDFEEVSGRSFYPLEEIVEKYIAWMVKQDPRQAQLKIGQRKPIPMEVSFVEEVTPRRQAVERLKEKIYTKAIDAQGTPYGSLTEELKKEIDARLDKFSKLTEGDYVKPPPKARKTKSKEKEEVPEGPKRKR